MRKIVAQRVITAWLANVVGVKAGHTERSCECGIAPQEGGLTAEAVQHAISVVALLDALDTNWFRFLHTIVGTLFDDFEIMRVLETHFRVVLVLDLWIGQSVTNGESCKVQCEQSLLDILVAPPDTMGNGRCVVSSVGF